MEACQLHLHPKAVGCHSYEIQPKCDQAQVSFGHDQWKRPLQGKTNLQLTYHLMVPRDTRLIIRHDVGLVKIREVTGQMDVSNRIGELDVSLAASLGASRKQLLDLVIGQRMRLAIPGLACGILLAFGLMRIMKSMMTELKNDDPLVYVGALAILGASAIVASMVPALRAAQVDPLRALRHE